MTSPSDKNHSDENLLNQRPREMGCLNCNYIILTAELMPKCENCGQLLIKVVYSVINGRSISGREIEQGKIE